MLVDEVRPRKRTVRAREAMKTSARCLTSDNLKPIPPLSQSRHADMACQCLYVRKHVIGGPMAETQAAARGIEVHQILATYINHLIRTKGSTDLELFDHSAPPTITTKLSVAGALALAPRSLLAGFLSLLPRFACWELLSSACQRRSAQHRPQQRLITRKEGQ